MNAVDMAQFIAPKSDQLNADDLIAGPITVTITGVSANEGSPEQPISVSFQGDDNKPFKPCKSMRRVMVHIWGADANAYIGRSMTLYRDPKVKFGGMQVGGIRISHMSDIPPTKLSDGKVQMALTESKAKRAPFTVHLLESAPAAKPAANGKDEAQEWTDKFITNVGRAPSLEKLDEFAAGKADMLDKLKAERASLYVACHDALNAKRFEFGQPASADDDDPFAEPQTDQPTDHTGFIAGIEKRIGGAATQGEIDDILNDIQSHTSLPTADADRLYADAVKKRMGLPK